MQLVMAAPAHLLSLVERGTEHAEEGMHAAALARERAAIDKAEAYYREAANGQAQMVYFVGMAAVAAVIARRAASGSRSTGRARSPR